MSAATPDQGPAHRVLLVSKFVHHVGGVETYLAWQAGALRRAGHEVAVVGMTPPAGSPQMDLAGAATYLTPYRAYTSGSTATRVTSAAASVWSPAAARTVVRAIEDFRPDVVHFHGTCYQLTSSVVRATAGRGLRRVATAHEYKLTCANQRLYDDRAAQVCERCVGAAPLDRLLNPVRTRCIKGSLGASLIGGVEAVVSDRVWRTADDLLIHAPSHFMARTLLADGWPPERVTTLDLPWPEQSTETARGGRDFLYLGRLAPEKDVRTLLAGWRLAGLPDARLVIAGDGAEDAALRRQVAEEGLTDVVLTGRVGRAELEDLLRHSCATVHPAAWFENSPFAVRESLMAGVPALVADIGGMPELVREGTTGSLVQHSPEGWAAALTRQADAGPVAGQGVLDAVDDYRTTEDAHLRALLELYRP